MAARLVEHHVSKPNDQPYLGRTRPNRPGYRDYQDVSSSNKATPRQLWGDNDHTPTLPTRREIWVPKAIKMCLLPNHWFLSIRTLHKCEICIPPETEHLSRCHMRMKLISDICGWSYGNLKTNSPIKPKRSYSPMLQILSLAMHSLPPIMQNIVTATVIAIVNKNLSLLFMAVICPSSMQILHSFNRYISHWAVLGNVVILSFYIFNVVAHSDEEPNKQHLGLNSKQLICKPG